MKKLTSPLFLSIAFVSVMLIYSCKKDIKHFFDDEKSTIEWAKDYYETKLQINQIYRLKLTASADKSISTNNNALINEKKPNWEKSKTGLTPYYEYVEIPLTYTHKITYTFGVNQNPNVAPSPNQKIIDASFDRLVIYKDKRGNISQRIITFIPDEDYLTKHKNNISHNRIDKLDNDFAGYLHYKDWDGKALFVLRIVKGKPIKKYNLLKFVTGKIPLTASSQTSGKLMVADAGGTTPQKCYEVSWSWYQDCYYLTPESEFPYYCDPAVIYNLSYIEKPCLETGGGTGGPNNEDPIDCLGVLIFETGECILDNVVPDPLDSILKDTCLNAAQMTALRTMFSEYLDGSSNAVMACINKIIYRNVVAKGKKIGFCIDSTQVSGGAAYKPLKGVIYFGNESNISYVGIFGHEFFHTFQDTYYPGGASQFNTGTLNGYPNIEFEQALFYDIVNGSSNANAMGSTADPLIIQEYKNWINSITNNNTKYPKQFSDFGGQYYNFLDKFYQNANGYIGIGLMKTDLPPNALLNIFSSSNCK